MKELIILEPGQRLREIRRKLGLKQEDLAGENMSKNYISMFENGKRRISVINATYIAEVLNRLARKNEIDLNVTASYFVKNEKDIARERCINWLDKLLDDKKNKKDAEYKDLYRIIYLSEKYELDDLLAKALQLKGQYLYRSGLYNCAITHFSKSLLYYVKQEDYCNVKRSYLSMGKTYFMNNNFKMALTYYNLAGLTEKEDDIIYYKALCYYKLGEFQLARSISDKIIFKDERAIELDNCIYNKLNQ